MKQKVDGLIVQDAEADRCLTYFLCAYYFGWTQQQVDATEYFLVEAMLEILPLWKAKTQDLLGDK